MDTLQMDTLPKDFNPFDKEKEENMLKYVFANAKKGDPESVINAIDKYCYNDNWMMNIGDVKGKLMDDALKCQPKTALELGSYCGYSSVRIGRLMKPGGKLISIDVLEYTTNIAKQVAEHAGLSEINEYWLGGLEKNIDKLEKEVGQLDFVFLDHFKDFYLPDIKLLESKGLLKKGTVIFGDNILFPGAPEYRKYVESNPKYQTVLHETELEYFRPSRKDIVSVSIYQG